MSQSNERETAPEVAAESRAGSSGPSRQWADVWRRVLKPATLERSRSPCRSPEHCAAGNLCDNCRAWESTQAEVEADRRARWFARQRLAPSVEHLRRLVACFPAEVAELLRPVVFGLFEAWWQTVKPEAVKALQAEVAKQTARAARDAAGLLAAEGDAGSQLRRHVTDALLPEIEDYLIDVVQGVLDARAEPLENPEADVAPEQAETSPLRGVES